MACFAEFSTLLRRKHHCRVRTHHSCTTHLTTPMPRRSMTLTIHLMQPNEQTPGLRPRRLLHLPPPPPRRRGPARAAKGVRRLRAGVRGQDRRRRRQRAGGEVAAGASGSGAVMGMGMGMATTLRGACESISEDTGACARACVRACVRGWVGGGHHGLGTVEEGTCVRGLPVYLISIPHQQTLPRPTHDPPGHAESNPRESPAELITTITTTAATTTDGHENKPQERKVEGEKQQEEDVANSAAQLHRRRRSLEKTAAAKAAGQQEAEAEAEEAFPSTKKASRKGKGKGSSSSLGYLAMAAGTAVAVGSVLVLRNPQLVASVVAQVKSAAAAAQRR